MAKWARYSAWVLVLAVIAGNAERLSAGSAVRGEWAAADDLVASGVSRSATIRELVSELNRSDVLVYVNLAFGLPSAAGYTRMSEGGGNVRVLRVFVNSRLDEARRLEILAHELTHCLEIARSPVVRDASGLISLERHIGWRTSAGESYETAAARAAERRVHEELAR